MTLYNNNLGESAKYFRQQSATISSVTLIPSTGQRPSANQKQVITGVWFYRRFGGVATRYFIRFVDNDTLAELAEIVVIPAIGGGEISTELNNMLFVGNLGQTVRVVYDAVDAAIDLICKFDYILV